MHKRPTPKHSSPKSGPLPRRQTPKLSNHRPSSPHTLSARPISANPSPFTTPTRLPSLRLPKQSRIPAHGLIPTQHVAHFASFAFPDPTQPPKPQHPSNPSSRFDIPNAFALKADRPVSMPSLKDLPRVNQDESQSDPEFDESNPKFKALKVDPQTMLSSDWARPQIRLEDFDQDSWSGEDMDANDPDSYRLVIPNRYTIEDFLLSKTTRIRDRIRSQVHEDFRNANQIDTEGNMGKSTKSPSWVRKLSKWRREKELAEYEKEDNQIRGVDSDLELYGGINFDQYNISVIRPNDQFKKKLLEARQVPEEYIQKQSTSWSQMVKGYKDGFNVVEDKTVTKNYLHQSINPHNPHLNLLTPTTNGKDYLADRTKGLLNDKKNANKGDGDDKIAVPELSPAARKESYSYTSHVKVYSKEALETDEALRTSLLSPSKQPAKGVGYTPRDAYETQMFIVHRIQTDGKLRSTLRDTFKHYTKELDPISGIQACQHLLSIELYLYLQTLEDTGVKVGFDHLGKQHKSFFARLRGEESMSTAATISVAQQYRTKYLEMVLADSTGELLHLWEEEWVQLIHCVTQLNPDVIRNAYIDRDTAYELLGLLEGLVKREQFVYDFEDQLNCMLIQFAKQRREQWDGDAYNNWKENRIQQLTALEQIHKQKGNDQDAFAAMKERRKIEMLGDDVDNAEQLNNDRIIDELISELDMAKLKMYITNGLMYYYRNQVYSDYGFEDDIGALLMTKALATIPDPGIIHLQDDILELANRVRSYELAQGEDDDIEEIMEEDEIIRDRATQLRIKEQKWDEENQYNENLNAASQRGRGSDRRTNAAPRPSSILSDIKPSQGLVNRMKGVSKRFLPNQQDEEIPQNYQAKYDQYGLPVVQPPQMFKPTSHQYLHAPKKM